MVILFEIIGHIGFIRLEAEDVSHQKKGSHCKGFINGRYVCKIMNTYHIIHVGTNNHNDHLPIIYSATSNQLDRSSVDSTCASSERTKDTSVILLRQYILIVIYVVLYIIEFINLFLIVINTWCL
jgi:hypothetical protein